MLTSFSMFAADKDLSMSGSQLVYDPDSGQNVVEVADIIGTDARIQAGKARFNSGSSPTPKVIELEDGVVIDTTTHTATADEATFYPLFNALSVRSLTVSQSEPLFTMMDPVQYHCSNGTLYGDGRPVPGNSVCLGGARLTCSETNPDYMIWEFNATECTLQPE